jgi:glycosyltransferase involved in cell wall biosynthesis
MSTPKPRVLFLEKAFLRRAPAVLRGVELFNLALIDDLLNLGWEVLADPSWRSALAPLGSLAHPTVLAGLAPGAYVVNLLSWRWRLRGRRNEVLLLGNVGHALLPVLRTLRARCAFDRAVLIAHRETSRRFLRAVQGLPLRVLAVNQKIAEPFLAAGFRDACVDYGIMHGERFFPAEPRRSADPVRFCVVGMLDNAWKGADTACEAFRALPAGIRDRCELHLASYSVPPRTEDPRIIAHAWMPAAELPEWLRTMDVMICPSRDEAVMRETFSQAMVQGMLTGLPVLASDLAIFREKLDRGGGEIFRDAADLSRKMATLAESQERRESLGNVARQTALERYVWDTSRFVERNCSGTRVQGSGFRKESGDSPPSSLPQGGISRAKAVSVLNPEP